MRSSAPLQKIRPTTEASSPRMGVSVHLLQAFGAHERVDLRGADGGMAEQLLHRSDVGAVVEQVGRTRVPQNVRGEDACQPCTITGLAHDRPHPLT